MPHYNVAFFNLPINRLPLWSAFEGSVLGALIVLALTWAVTTIVKRDWHRLIVGTALAVGTFGLERAAM